MAAYIAWCLTTLGNNDWGTEVSALSVVLRLGSEGITVGHTEIRVNEVCENFGGYGSCPHHVPEGRRTTAGPAAVV